MEAVDEGKDSESDPPEPRINTRGRFIKASKCQQHAMRPPIALSPSFTAGFATEGGGDVRNRVRTSPFMAACQSQELVRSALAITQAPASRHTVEALKHRILGKGHWSAAASEVSELSTSSP